MVITETIASMQITNVSTCVEGKSCISSNFVNCLSYDVYSVFVCDIHYIDFVYSDPYGMLFTWWKYLFAVDNVAYLPVTSLNVTVFAVAGSWLRLNFVFVESEGKEHDELENSVVDYYANVKKCFSFQMR